MAPDSRGSLSARELSQRAIQEVAAWSGGSLAPDSSSNYHVESPSHGRLRVHARSRASKSLIWFGVPAPSADGYDAAVLVEFAPDDTIAVAWKLTKEEVEATATSMTVRNGRRILKIAVGGEWTRRVARLNLGPASG